jgi:hypothetical protein
MYYWDGQAWRSALSPDGRFRWDGSTWTPVPSMAGTAYGPATRPQAEPTSWTRPLQYSVIGWYVWSIIWILATPILLGGMMGNLINQSLQRQQQLSPQVSPPPAAFYDVMSGIANVSLWVTAVLYSAAFVVIIVGAWKRWTWMYYVVLVLLGLTTILAPVNLADIFLGPTLNRAYGGLTMPSWLYWAAFVTSIPAVALFVWMVIALFKRGPWAMRRPSVG